MKLLQWEQYSAFSVIWVLLLFYLLYMCGLLEKVSKHIFSNY